MKFSQMVALFLSLGLVTGADLNSRLLSEIGSLKSILILDPNSTNQVAFFIETSVFIVELQGPQKAKCVKVEEGAEANLGQLISCVSLYLFRDLEVATRGIYFCRKAQGSKWSFFNLALKKLDDPKFAHQQTYSEYVFTYDKEFYFSRLPHGLEFIQPDVCRKFKWYKDEEPGKEQVDFGHYQVARMKQRLIFCEPEFAKQSVESCRPAGVMVNAFESPPHGFIYNKNLYLLDQESVLIMDAAKLLTAYEEEIIEIKYQTIPLHSFFDGDHLWTASVVEATVALFGIIILLLSAVVFLLIVVIKQRRPLAKSEQKTTNTSNSRSILRNKFSTSAISTSTSRTK